MERCPFCGSEDIYFSKKRKLFVCEDCDETFSDGSVLENNKKSMAGLEIFFSYGHDRNRILVERIKRDLEQRGHHVWIDTSEIRVGDSWRNDILTGVLNASKIIAFLSEHSTREPGVCLDELKIAICVKGADVKTVLLEPENKIKQPATLSDIQWLDMSAWYEMKNSDSDFETWYQLKFAELCRVIESVNSTELSGDIHYLKGKLSPYLNTEKEYHLLSKEFYGRKWLEEYIENWRDNKKAKALVIYGKPGSGKSAFSVNFSHYNPNVYGCFLCEWNKEFSVNPNRLIRTMAFRLATKIPDYRSLLIQQLSCEDSSLDEMNDDALFDFLLSYPLNHLVDGNREIGMILVDGLDEAEKDGENPVAAVFAKCVERMPRWIRFVFTSRPERNVSTYFLDCDSIDMVDDMPLGYNDIMAFLVKTLADNLKNIPNKLETLNCICELSEGVFLYAEMMVEDIKSGSIDIGDIQGLPRGLNAFYRISMERKFRTNEEFASIKKFVELLTVGDVIPEKLLVGASGYSQYSYLIALDRLGSWVNRQDDNGIVVLSFSHKSLMDWFTNKQQSGGFYIDEKCGAFSLARYCKSLIDKRKTVCEGFLVNYAKAHIGPFYIAAGAYLELEDFLLQHENELYPYWMIWNEFPNNWDHEALMCAFWHSKNRNVFVRTMQREGNTNYLTWIFEKAHKLYGIGDFDREMISIYMDMVHMSGKYSEAVDIAKQYLAGNSRIEIVNDDFLSMLSIRKIHHSMFYKPVRGLLEEAVALYPQMEDCSPVVINELLFLIGGNLGVLSGDWNFVKTWLDRSLSYAVENNLEDFIKRNIRKIADYYCACGMFQKGIDLINEHISDNRKATSRYEDYLIGAMGNLLTCAGYGDEALQCYEEVLKYSTSKGIVGWIAHANLGIANVNFSLGNIKEAVDFATRASNIYMRIHHEWGCIMSNAILSICESKMGIAPIKVACKKTIEHAKRMQYESCVASIEDVCNGKINCLKLYFL